VALDPPPPTYNLIELKVETICGIGKINRLMRDVVIWVDYNIGLGLVVEDLTGVVEAE
jgi:hypothetical protein